LTTDYTVDLTLGKIHFVVIPVTGTPSNVDIGWTKGTGQRTLIENCLYEMDYSGQLIQEFSFGEIQTLKTEGFGVA